MWRWNYRMWWSIPLVLGMAMGQGRVEGWDLRLCPAWFCLTLFLSYPAWWRKLSHPFFLGFRIITLYFKLRKTRVLVSILVFMKLLTLRKAYSFLNVACNLVIIKLLTLTKTYSFLHGKLKFHFKIITKISKFLANKFIVLWRFGGIANLYSHAKG